MRSIPLLLPPLLAPSMAFICLLDENRLHPAETSAGLAATAATPPFSISI